MTTIYNEATTKFSSFVFGNFIKVHLTPKYFFHLNKSLHLFKMHCAFLN